MELFERAKAALFGFRPALVDGGAESSEGFARSPFEIAPVDPSP
jgi:hypothetical protein